MLIDFHTHVFPEKIAARTLRALKDGIVRIQGCEPNSFTDATVAGLRTSMKAQGVDKSVVLPIATKPTQAPTINAYALSLQSEDVVSFGSLHPMQQDWEGVLETLAEQGFIGIKLHPEFQQCYVDAPETVRILRKAEQLGLYTVLHTGCDIGIEPPVHCSPECLSHVLQEVSGQYIIAAHMGGWRMWDEVERCLIGTPIWLDTAFVGGYLPAEQYRRMILAHGRVLFGSDSPWERPADTLAALKALNLPETELQKILYENAASILML